LCVEGPKVEPAGSEIHEVNIKWRVVEAVGFVEIFHTVGFALLVVHFVVKRIVSKLCSMRAIYIALGLSLIYLELFFSDLVLVVVFVCLRRQPLEVHRRAILDWRICFLAEICGSNYIKIRKFVAPTPSTAARCEAVDDCCFKCNTLGLEFISGFGVRISTFPYILATPSLLASVLSVPLPYLFASYTTRNSRSSDICKEGEVDRFIKIGARVALLAVARKKPLPSVVALLVVATPFVFISVSCSVVLFERNSTHKMQHQKHDIGRSILCVGRSTPDSFCLTLVPMMNLSMRVYCYNLFVACLVKYGPLVRRLLSMQLSLQEIGDIPSHKKMSEKTKSRNNTYPNVGEDVSGLVLYFDVLLKMSVSSTSTCMSTSGYADVATVDHEQSMMNKAVRAKQPYNDSSVSKLELQNLKSMTYLIICQLVL
uniref:Uncharacterized protein n=1 Tax=Cucumis melo TaxID=3656 RepID=A0A9I9E5S1_CUCME